MLTEERCKQLMEQVGMPESRSIMVALYQVANETEQAATAPLLEEIERLKQRCAELEKDAARWKTHVEVAGEQSHKCKQCHFEYTPNDDGNEDCPRCGFDGIDSAMSGQEHSNG